MQKVSQLVWDCPQCGRRLAKHVERCLCGLRQQPTWDEQRSRTTKTGGTSVPSKADTTRASANSPSPNATSDSSATATSTCPQCRGNVPKTVERCPCGHWLHEKSSHAAIPSKPESTSKQRGFVSTAVVIALDGGAPSSFPSLCKSSCMPKQQWPICGWSYSSRSRIGPVISCLLII